MVRTRAAAQQDNKMEREKLEAMTTTQLKEEAQRLEVSLSDDRAKLIDAIMFFVERKVAVGDPTGFLVPQRITRTTVG